MHEFRNYVFAGNPSGFDQFGTSCALSADGAILAVGAPREDTISTDSGMVYIFDWNGTTWTERSRITASNTGNGDQLGMGCALSADGSILAVGAPREDTITDAGMVYIFDWNGTSWTERSQVTPSNAGASDQFGSGCALSADGSILAVGAWYEDSLGSNSGMAYVFDWNGTAWVERSQITASNTGATDYFGMSCALSGDGSILAVGAPAEDTAGSNAGATYIFDWNGTSWVQRTLLTASNAGSSDSFGESCALSADGTILAVGAKNEDTIAADAGMVYVFDWNGTAWVEEKLTFVHIRATDYFGASCALSANGSILAVGAPADDTRVADAGKCTVFYDPDRVPLDIPEGSIQIVGTVTLDDSPVQADLYLVDLAPLAPVQSSVEDGSYSFVDPGDNSVIPYSNKLFMLCDYGTNKKPLVHGPLTPVGTPPPADAYWDNVELLVPSDTDFNDVTDNAYVPSSTMGVSLDTSIVKFGEGSAKHTANWYLPFFGTSAIGTQDFTVEGWFYITTRGYLFGLGMGSVPTWNSSNILLTILPDNRIYLLKAGGSNTFLITPTTPIPLNEWVHIALAKQDTTIRLFVNGELYASAAFTLSIDGGATIGHPNYYLMDGFVGYSDDFRLTIGVARYTEDFTPPTEAFPIPGV